MTICHARVSNFPDDASIETNAQEDGKGREVSGNHMVCLLIKFKFKRQPMLFYPEKGQMKKVICKKTDRAWSSQKLHSQLSKGYSITLSATTAVTEAAGERTLTTEALVSLFTLSDTCWHRKP